MYSKKLAARLFFAQDPADGLSKLLVHDKGAFDMQFQDEVYLVDQVFHILDASRDLNYLDIFHVEQPADLYELCLASAVDLVNYQDDRLVDRKYSLDILDDPDVLLQGVDVCEILLIAPRPHLAFIVYGVAEVVDIGIILYSLYRVRDLAGAFNATDQDVFAVTDRLSDIVDIVTSKSADFVILFCHIRIGESRNLAS